MCQLPSKLTLNQRTVWQKLLREIASGIAIEITYFVPFISLSSRRKMDGSTYVDPKEPSLCELLQRLLTDERLNDITLKGIDGVEVRANRYILAARSPVFHR